MGVEYFTTQSESYRNKKAISNSLMNTYLTDFKDFVSYWKYGDPIERKIDDSLSLGIMIDTLLNEGREGLDEKVMIFDGKAPTGQMLKFVEYLSGTVDQNFEVAYEMTKEWNGGKLRDSLDTFKDKFKPHEDYYKTLIEANKIVVATDFINLAEQRVLELKTNDYTKLLINLESSKNIDVYKSLEIFSQYENLPIKGALDKVIVDHKKKRIIPLDYKTSAFALGFRSTALKYSYYRQGSFYTYLLEKWKIDNNLENYEITPFMFIVISTTQPNIHFLSRMNSNDINVGRYGGFTKLDREIKGWQEVLNEISYLTKKDQWTYPYEIVINNGIMDLDLFIEYEPDID